MKVYVIYEQFDEDYRYPEGSNIGQLVTHLGYFMDYDKAVSAAKKYISQLDTNHDMTVTMNGRGYVGYSVEHDSDILYDMCGRYTAFVIPLEEGT